MVGVVCGLGVLVVMPLVGLCECRLRPFAALRCRFRLPVLPSSSWRIKAFRSDGFWLSDSKVIANSAKPKSGL